MRGLLFCRDCDGFGCEYCGDTGKVRPSPADLADVFGALLIFAFIAFVPLYVLYEATS